MSLGSDKGARNNAARAALIPATVTPDLFRVHCAARTIARCSRGTGMSGQPIMTGDTLDLSPIALAAAAGLVGGAMNALAGGGMFATLPSLIALGLPANVANATSNVALLPGAGTSAWAFRDELGRSAGSDSACRGDHLRRRTGRQRAARADARAARSTSSFPGWCCSRSSAGVRQARGGVAAATA